MKSSPPVVILDIKSRAREQQIDRLLVSDHHGKVQRCSTLFITAIGILLKELRDLSPHNNLALVTVIPISAINAFLPLASTGHVNWEWASIARRRPSVCLWLQLLTSTKTLYYVLERSAALDMVEVIAHDAENVTGLGIPVSLDHLPPFDKVQRPLEVVKNGIQLQVKLR